MGSQAPKPGKASRWGSLLQGAVAGLEKGLDNILAEENAAAAAAARAKQKTAAAAAATTAATPKSGLLADTQQSDSTLPKSDLAQKFSSRRSRPLHATNGEEHAKSTSSSAVRSVSSQSELPNASSTTFAAENDVIPLESAEPTGDGTTINPVTTTTATAISKEERTPSLPAADRTSTPDPLLAHQLSGQEDVKFDNDDAPRPSQSSDRPPHIADILTGSSDTPRSSAELSTAARPASNDLDEPARDEEIQSYLERIDALQAKLQYLAKDAADSARQTAASTPRDTSEHQLAAKDEQIALLMEEGQKLSKLELSHTTIIKKLRARVTDDSRTHAQTTQRLAKAEKLAGELSAKVTRMEAAQKEAQARIQRLGKAEEEAARLRDDVEARQALVEDLQARLAESEQELVSNEGLAKALEIEKSTTARLSEELAAAKAEHKSSEERHQTDITALRGELQNERDKTKTATADLHVEISTLESRLEVYRSRAEEATSRTATDAHAQLLRQVETLQSQYLAASENWSGIEATLQARATALAKERDEAAAHEHEARRRARETGTTTRRLQEQLEAAGDRGRELERELGEQTARVGKLQDRAHEFERNLQEARAAFEMERVRWQAGVAERIEAERAKWLAELPQPSIESPVARNSSPTYRKGSMVDTGGSIRRNIGRLASHDLTLSTFDRPFSRRSTTQPSKSWDSNGVISPPGAESGRSTPFFSGMAGLDTPSVRELDVDETHDGTTSPLRNVNDVMSVSTVAAGPSVQLVERMSATVRRLESEKALSKDELSRMLAQRDEARQEVVELMREVEGTRGEASRLQRLEKELDDVNKRYATTLELLGERSERVEELEADVADLKKIYRELVDSTMR